MAAVEKKIWHLKLFHMVLFTAFFLNNPALHAGNGKNHKTAVATSTLQLLQLNTTARWPLRQHSSGINPHKQTIQKLPHALPGPHGALLQKKTHREKMRLTARSNFTTPVSRAKHPRHKTIAQRQSHIGKQHKGSNPTALGPISTTTWKKAPPKSEKPHIVGQANQDLAYKIRTPQRKGHSTRRTLKREISLELDHLTKETYSADAKNRPQDKKTHDSERKYSSAANKTSEFSKVKFLLTADPQFYNGHERNKQSDHVLRKIGSLMHNDSEIHGLIIPGDLTQNSRINDEFRDYHQSINNFQEKVYDGVGNHDLHIPNFLQTLSCHFNLGSCVSPARIINNIRARSRKEEVCLHYEGTAYSWNWDDIHFIQLGVFAGDTPDPSLQVNPLKSLDFLAADLKAQPEGTPVVLVMHYNLGMLSDAQKNELGTVLLGHNIVALIHGHEHTKGYCVLKHSSTVVSPAKWTGTGTNYTCNGVNFENNTTFSRDYDFPGHVHFSHEKIGPTWIYAYSTPAAFNNEYIYVEIDGDTLKMYAASENCTTSDFTRFYRFYPYKGGLLPNVCEKMTFIEREYSSIKFARPVLFPQNTSVADRKHCYPAPDEMANIPIGYLYTIPPFFSLLYCCGTGLLIRKQWKKHKHECYFNCCPGRSDRTDGPHVRYQRLSETVTSDSDSDSDNSDENISDQMQRLHVNDDGTAL